MKFQLTPPVDLPMIVTQHFGANPGYYGRFGLPGHEGLDIRARTGAKIYAAAAGTVTRLGNYPPGTAYGYHIRLTHRCDDGNYETIYAHLQTGSAYVKIGDVVEAGQLIALADATGNVIAGAAHLHFGLKKAGATARQETRYPSDFIDPTSYFLMNGDGGQQTRVIVTATPSLRVRQDPIGNAPIVGRLNPQTAVDVVEIRSGWGRIEQPVRGWISLAWTKPA